MRKIIVFKLLVIILLMNNGCDTNKYLSSNLNMVEGLDSTYVSGFVLRFDNGKGVENALIKFAYQKTTTNSFGFYQINLVMTDDDQRNLNYPIVVSAEKYISHYSVELLLPIPQEFNYNLLWRPPIVYKGALVINPYFPEEKVVQVLVKDYEGVQNISNVSCFLFEKKPGPDIRFDFPLHFKWNVDSITAFFESDIFTKELAPFRGQMPVPVIATDNYGFIDTLVFEFPRFSIPIFPINWGETDKWRFND